MRNAINHSLSYFVKSYLLGQKLELMMLDQTVL